MKKYKSKIGLSFVIPMAFLIGLIVYGAIQEASEILLIFLMLALVFVFDVVRRTYYFIDQDTLVARCSFSTYKVPIESIRRISKTTDLTSAPALSWDRLEIAYNKYDTLIISPENRQEFISEIIKKNSRIIVAV